MNMHHKPSLFVQLAPTLVKNGWRPIPGYADTKRPSITRWNDLNNAQWPPDKLDETLEGQGQLEGRSSVSPSNARSSPSIWIFSMSNRPKPPMTLRCGF